MKVRASLVADAQAAVLREPVERALDHAAMASHARLRFDAYAHNAVLDAPGRACPSARSNVVALVGVDLRWPTSASTRATVVDRRDRVDHRLERLQVVQVRWARSHRQRHARRIDVQVVLSARCGPSVRSVGSGRAPRPPLCRHVGGIDAGSTPVDAVGFGQAVQQLAVQTVHAAAASRLGWQRHPRDACLEHEHDARQGGAVVHERTATLGMEAMR